jgi:hypothetical protein
MSLRELTLAVLAFASVGFSVLAADADPEQAVREQARAACDAFVRGDLDKFAGLTHPKLVQTMGGRERTIELLKSGQKEMNARGIRLLSASLQPQVQLAQGGDEWFAVVPYQLEMGVPEGRALVKTWLLGVSADQGKSWTFVDGGKLNVDGVKRLFPDFPAKLSIPAKQPPQLERKKS